jgi:O-antigen ligase
MIRKIDIIWNRFLLYMFFLFVFAMETTIFPTNEVSTLDPQTLIKLILFYSTYILVLPRFTSGIAVNRPVACYAGLLCFVAASVFWSRFPLTSAAFFGVWLAFTLLAVRLIQQNGIGAVTWVFHCSILTVCAISLVTYFLGLESAVYSEAVSNAIAVRRVKGITGSPSTLGSLSGISLILSSFYFLLMKRRCIIIYVSMIVSAVVLYLSYSRTCQLAAILCCGVVFYAKLPSRLLKFVVIAFFFATIVYASLNFQNFDLASKTKSGDVNEITTLTGRTSIWAEAVKKIRQRPLVGGGLGAAKWLVAEGRYDYDRTYTTSHNFILESLLEFGVVGTFLYVSVFILTFSSILKLDSAQNSHKPLFLLLLVYIAVLGITEKSFVGPLNTKTAVFILTIFFGTSRNSAPCASDGCVTLS